MQASYNRRGVLAGVTAALAAGTAGSVQAAAVPAVLQPILDLVDGLLRVMKEGPGTPFAQRIEILGPIIDRSFDLAAILRESVGGPWAMLPQDQQQMLSQAFRRYTIATYVNSFNTYDGQRFEVKPDTRTVGNEQVVQTQLIPKSGESHELDYVMRQGNSGWHAVDVLADGSISRVAVQRSDFRRLLVRGGAQALADSLRSKSADLTDGSS
jgi:phospholipid transport system substrate-binding protein